MPSPLSVEHGFLPHVPSPAGDFDCGEYFDFAAYERDRGDGVLHHHHHHHPRSSCEGSIHTPALTAASTATPPSDRFEGLGRHAAGHLNSLPGDLGFDDDEWAYSSSDLSHGDFSLMLNSDFPSSSSSSSPSSYSSSPPSYSSSSHPPSSASSPPSSYPPSPPSFTQDARRGRSETSSSSGSSSKGSSKKRHLHRPEQTAEVRENGACIRCRIRRVRVSWRPTPTHGLITTANLPPHTHVFCRLGVRFLGPIFAFWISLPHLGPAEFPFWPLDARTFRVVTLRCCVLRQNPPPPISAISASASRARNSSTSASTSSSRQSGPSSSTSRVSRFSSHSIPNAPLHAAPLLPCRVPHARRLVPGGTIETLSQSCLPSCDLGHSMARVAPRSRVTHNRAGDREKKTTC